MAPFDPNVQHIDIRLLPPSPHHWLGTDGFGRDLLSRVIYGARPTLLLIILILVLTLPVGLLLGIGAGYFGGWTERILMRITDIVMSLPSLVIALALVAMMGPGLMNGALALTSWPPFARQARTETLALRRSDYLAAARMQGISGLRLMFGHILPLCLPSAVVRAALSLGGIILAAAGLGFLGMGIQPPTAEWGSMVAEGSKVIFDQWWGRLRRAARFCWPAWPSICWAMAYATKWTLDMPNANTPLLQVDRLRITLPAHPPAVLVDTLSFTLGQERVALVGESGSGKSLTARALMGLLPALLTMDAAGMRFCGRDLTRLRERDWNLLRGNDIAIVLQDPKYALNPAQTVGNQVMEPLVLHQKLGRRERREKMLETLAASACRIRANSASVIPISYQGEWVSG